jgi:3-dehydroquinate dehydratase
MNENSDQIDVFEIRLDYLEDLSLENIIKTQGEKYYV